MALRPTFLADKSALARMPNAAVRARLDDDVFDRALEVQGLLADRGQHRLPIPDLVISAAAESAGLTVLPYDADFDCIA